MYELKKPSSFKSLSEAELEYDGGFMDGCEDWQKGLAIFGIVVGSLAATYGILRLGNYIRVKHSFKPGVITTEVAPNLVNAEKYPIHDAIHEGMKNVNVDGFTPNVPPNIFYD